MSNSTGDTDLEHEAPSGSGARHAGKGPTWEPLRVSNAFRVLPRVVEDQRGWFMRYLSLPASGGGDDQPAFVQFNHSCTRRAGTIRGLHLQIGKGREAKFVKCVRGRVLDVLLDLRRGSSTFLEHAAVELSAESHAAVYAPPGVAHGFQTLEPHTELIYHHTNAYIPSAERGVRFDDPRAGIRWPRRPSEISEKDRQWPLLSADFDGYEVA